mgnify:FL=1
MSERQARDGFRFSHRHGTDYHHTVVRISPDSDVGQVVDAFVGFLLAAGFHPQSIADDLAEKSQEMHGADATPETRAGGGE